MKPSDVQPDLPLDRLIISEPPDAENIEMDVVFVGGGPAGLTGAIELARLVKRSNESGNGLGEINIAVLEKSETLGEHCLSGAIVNPIIFRELFPDLSDDDFPFLGPVRRDSVFFLTEKRAFRVPTPPTMHNRGNFTASICELVRWLGAKAEELGVDVFPGFPAGGLLVDGNKVRGVRTIASGLDRDGNETSSYMPPTDIVARVTALAEGTRGVLSQAYLEWSGLRIRRSMRLASRSYGKPSLRSIPSSIPWGGRFPATYSAAASCTRRVTTFSRWVLWSDWITKLLRSTSTNCYSA